MREIIYIRTDANSKIGTGHVMRCLSIADRIKELGGTTIFIIADYQSEQIIKEKGYEIICIHSQWNNLDSEIKTMVELCHKKSVKKLIIDSYFITENYLENLNKITNVTYIDDLNTFLYPVNKLINYNFYAEDMKYTDIYKKTHTRLFIGTNYVPLRREFENTNRRKFSGIKKILITSGGTDNFNMIGNILERLLNNQKYQNIEMYCILGRFNINKEKVEQTYEKFTNVHLLSNISNMDFYMKECDLCITAGGTTVYELCACGIPSILYLIADNQINMAKKVSSIGLIYLAGDVRNGIKSCLDKIEDGIALYMDAQFWNKISHHMKTLVDGRGALRIAEAILQNE